MAAHPALKEAAEVADVKDGNGLNIEGLAFDAGGERLLVGFRGPLVDGKAMLVAIENVDEVFDKGAEPRIADEAILLDLGGDGIRGMTYDPRLEGFLIISGPLEQVEDVPFRLWFWSRPGGAAAAARDRARVGRVRARRGDHARCAGAGRNSC